MAYSNTNKDKVQHDLGKTAKSVALTVVLIITIVSSVSSIYQQGSSLLKARVRNREMESKMEKLSRENRRLTQLIEEATSSAKTMRQARAVLGLGTSNDYWLIMPKTADQTDSIQTPIKSETKPIVLQWWELFTK